MLAGALEGLKYGLVKSVSPLAIAEDNKDLEFDNEIEAIRSAAAAAAAAPGDGGVGDDDGVPGLGASVKDGAKELVSA